MTTATTAANRTATTMRRGASASQPPPPPNNADSVGNQSAAAATSTAHYVSASSGRFSGEIEANRMWYDVRYELERRAGFYNEPRASRKRTNAPPVVGQRRACETSRFVARRAGDGRLMRVDDVVRADDVLLLQRVPMELDASLAPHDIGAAYRDGCLFVEPVRVDYSACADDDDDARLAAFLAQTDALALGWLAPLNDAQRKRRRLVANLDADVQQALDSNGAPTPTAHSPEQAHRVRAPTYEDGACFGLAADVPPPAAYRCHRCAAVGKHYRSTCPTQADPTWRVKRQPLGIPRAQLRVASNERERAMAPFFDPCREGVYLMAAAAATSSVG